MPFMLPFARSLCFHGIGITVMLLLSTSPMLAQTTPAQKPSQLQRPAPKTPPIQPQSAGPLVVELKASPAQPEWTKVCGKDPSSTTEICYTTRDFVSEKDQPLLAVALYDVKGKQPQKVMRLLIPLGLLLQPGIRIAIDQNQASPGRYASCLPNGCFAEVTVKNDFVAALKKSTTLNVSARNQTSQEVTFAVPMAGFGKALDGPPIDPKVLEEQQRKMQEDMKKLSNEIHQRLMNSPGTSAQVPATAAAPTELKQ
jgi:invasion protein IalB